MTELPPEEGTGSVLDGAGPLAEPEDGESIEDYAEALPETARPTAPEPDEDAGHLLPDGVWARVVRRAEEHR